MFGRGRMSLALAGSAVVTAFGWGAPASAALPAECAETGPTIVKCTYTIFSASKQFVVPAGVTSIHAKAVGAPGESTSLLGSTIPGGRGAIVTADLSVAPGSTLTAFPASKTSVDRGAGDSCGRGGGASGIRKGDLLSDRILVAGGGGGAGCGVGGAGGDAGSNGGGPGGGGPGTQTFGGAGGTATPPSEPGAAGSFGQGGDGGWAADQQAGGGGGGGWYGGGGGGSGFLSGGTRLGSGPGPSIRTAPWSRSSTRRSRCRRSRSPLATRRRGRSASPTATRSPRRATAASPTA